MESRGSRFPIQEKAMRRAMGGICTSAVLVMLAAVATADDKKKTDKPADLDKIPKAVMAALKAKFPKAEIDKWTKEKDEYDIEFKQEGRKFEADIKEDGTIVNWEKAIAAKDLPEAVTSAVEKKYPKS